MGMPNLGPKWQELQQNLWGPQEKHGEDGDCANPYCNYEFTSEELETAEWVNNGTITCPQCNWTQNVRHLVGGDSRDRTRSGMSLSQMGDLGESVVKQYAEENNGVPGLGQLIWESPTHHDPIDLVIGPYAIEVKSLHSESFPRFKIAADPSSGKNRADVIRSKHDRMRELSQHFEQEFQPAVLGVRLNFYTNRADFFFATEYKDRLITAMQHIGYTDFSSLNPFKPEEVAQSQLPAQGETSGDSDIPF